MMKTSQMTNDGDGSLSPVCLFPILPLPTISFVLRVGVGLD